MGADIRDKMKALIDQLNEAAKVYYSGKDEIMTNAEYDEKYDQLARLEKESGIILGGSPTQRVGYEVLSQLPKEEHSRRMLSLDKTKSVEELKDWLGSQEGVLSWKLDGLTVVLTYRNGRLQKAVTRGNGTIGEVITPNAKTFVNLPISIPFKGELVVRGEAVISYKDFERINEGISNPSEKYKNPRNLCSGSVRQLNSEITAQRHVQLIAFALVEISEDGPKFQHISQQFDFLKEQGFEVVEHFLVSEKNIAEQINSFKEHIEKNPIPSDGLVLIYNDIAYGQSLGETAKFPRNAMAFKWEDQRAITTLREIIWSPSRTGLINPIASFDPVELEGTTVTRASLHNLSIIKELKLGIGDEISVYKANMIIPQVLENFTESNHIDLPTHCPICQGDVVVRSENDVETLYCPNPHCMAKKVKGLVLMASRDGLNIEGLSEATLTKFVDEGFIKEPRDVFRLREQEDKIVSLAGFGQKSFDNLVSAVEKARDTEDYRFLYSLGIPNIGAANAKAICMNFDLDMELIMDLREEDLASIEGIGDVMAKAYVDYFRDEENRREALDLLAELHIKEVEVDMGDKLRGLTFVITGSLNLHKNRDALKSALEGEGGKVAGSVSSKTSYLINNNTQSSSGKNKKAKELGIPIIDEVTVDDWIKNGVKA